MAALVIRDRIVEAGTDIRNAQNDITGIIDDTGALVVQYRYDAWGKPVSTT